MSPHDLTIMAITSHGLIIMAGLVVCFGITTFVISERLGIPSIVLLLLVGVIAGPEVLGLVRPDDFGVGIQVLVPLLVAIIVFEGGLVLDIDDLRQVSYPVQMLISVGALVTWGGAALAAHYVASLSWSLAILFGALVSVTGPTVITPLMRRSNARERLKVLLQAEGVLVDAVGAILAVVVLDVLLTSGTALGGAFEWVERLGIGVVVGAIGGIILGYSLRAIGGKLSAETTRLSTLGGAIAIFIVAEAFSSEAGIAAAAVSGIVVGNIDFPHEEEVVHFKGDLTILAITIIFILLAARLQFEDLAALGWGGILTVLLLMLVIRPLCVFASTIGSTLTLRERLFLSAVSPRGVVAASVATFAALELDRVGFAGSDLLIGLVFMTVIGTVVIQGFTTPWLARLLGVEPMTTIIVGANDIGRALGKQLMINGRDATLIDTESANVQSARQMGLTVIEADAGEVDTLRKAGINRAQALVAVTESDKLNLLVCQMARSQFDVKQVIARADSDSTAQVLHDLNILTMNPLSASVLVLDNMVRRPSTLSLLTDLDAGKVVREILLSNPRLFGKPLKTINLPGDVLVAMLRRNGSLFVPHGVTQFQRGDEITLIGTHQAVDDAALLFSEAGADMLLSTSRS